MRFVSLVFLAFLTGSALFGQKDTTKTFPVGHSDHDMEGLQVALRIPQAGYQGPPRSLVILLHGHGGKGKRLMNVLNTWLQAGYIVCAPQARAKSWSQPDLEAVERIGQTLVTALKIDPQKVHVMGFSNGGWNLPRLAFSEVLKPCSAVYVAAGFKGARPPKWAVKSHRVLAVAGADDPAATATIATPKILDEKVKAAEYKLEPNLGHKWPRTLNPYMLWWMGIAEGRFEMGQSLAFDWQQNLEAALKSISKQKKGCVLGYVYDSKNAKQAKLAKFIETESFFDPLLRFYVDQVAAVEFDLSLKPAPFAKLPDGPCIVIIGKDGKIKKTLKGKIKAKSIRTSLKKYVSKKKLDSK